VSDDGILVMDLAEEGNDNLALLGWLTDGSYGWNWNFIETKFGSEEMKVLKMFTTIGRKAFGDSFYSLTLYIETPNDIYTD
jgi:hypothetical protein